MNKYRIYVIIALSLVSYNKLLSAYFGPEIIYKEYSENLQNSLKSEEKGILYGFRGGITSSMINFLYSDLSVEYAQGKTKYTGTKQKLQSNEIIPFKSISNNTFLNTEGSIGLIFGLKKIAIKPFGGIGYHIWERKLTEYSEKFNWLYFHLGGNLSFNIISFYDIGIEAKVFQTKFAAIKIKDIYPWQQDMNLSNKLQYSVKIYNKLHSNHLNIYLAAFYRNLNMGASKNTKKSSFAAPSSSDVLLGSELILEYNF